MNLCIPYNSIERIGGQLSANSWVAYGRRQATPETIQQISRAACASRVQLNVRLAQTRIGTGELIGLRVGDVITTQKDVHSPAGGVGRGDSQVPRQPGGLQGPQGRADRRRHREPGRSPGTIVNHEASPTPSDDPVAGRRGAVAPGVMVEVLPARRRRGAGARSPSSPAFRRWPTWSSGSAARGSKSASWCSRARIRTSSSPRRGRWWP